MPKGWWSLVFAVLALGLALAGMAIGSVNVPVAEVWRALARGGGGAYGTIVLQVRLPEVLTAMVAGSGLAASGLLMQTVFRNPLAGPGVLGISGGASLGAALVMLARPAWGLPGLPQDLLVAGAAWCGAAAVLLLVVLADRRVGGGVTLLVLGLMVGYLCSALLGVLQAASEAGALKGFVLWGMGSFGGLELARLPWLLVPVLPGLAVATALAKPLNAMVLGDEQALAMGVEVARVRRTALWTAGVLTGTVTAFCGPVAFLGLAVPHVAGALMRTADHRHLMPATILLGAALAQACDLVVRAPWAGQALPLNAVTGLVGIPVVLWVLLRGAKWSGKP